MPCKPVAPPVPPIPIPAPFSIPPLPAPPIPTDNLLCCQLPVIPPVPPIPPLPGGGPALIAVAAALETALAGILTYIDSIPALCPRE